MAKYGYCNHSFSNKRDDDAITAIFNVLPCESITVEQIWNPNSKSRAGLEELVMKMNPGDVLFVNSIDRLGASVDDVIRQWNRITQEKLAHIVVLNEYEFDTRKNHYITLPQLIMSIRKAFDEIAYENGDATAFDAKVEVIHADQEQTKKTIQTIQKESRNTLFFLKARPSSNAV
ncbi:MAG TPA: recombinase family protein [Bacillota bacterium]|nr:recombinase family protein [Bacillota bacterium]